MAHNNFHTKPCLFTAAQRERDRDTDTETDRERERDRVRQTETDSDRDRDRQTETEAETERDVCSWTREIKCHGPCSSSNATEENACTWYTFPHAR